MKKFYVGRKFDLSREIISTNETPTKNIFVHKYIYCLGPFDTKDAAEYMAGPGWNNPKCKTIKDAEKLIKELKDKAA